MSVMQRLLNPWLRAVEKRRLRTGTPAALRRALEVQSRLFFHGPRGTQQQWVSYGDIQCREMTPRNCSTERVLFTFMVVGLFLVVLTRTALWLLNLLTELARGLFCRVTGSRLKRFSLRHHKMFGRHGTGCWPAALNQLMLF
jgi:hypothetical protein